MLLIAILLCVSVVSINGDTDCLSLAGTLTSCLAQIAIPGKPSACDCWSNYKSAAGSCSNDFYAQCNVAKAICGTADCSIVVTDCPSAVTALAVCSATNPLDQCTCLNNFKTNAKQYCTKPEDALLSLTTCNTNKAFCNGGSCDADCQALVNLIPGCQRTYDNCTGGDKCVCYTQLTACMAVYDICDDVKITQLKACIENQFDCISVKGTCDSSEYSISLSDVDALFQKYKAKFISLWNNALTTVAATIQTCEQVVSSTKITWTLTIDYNSTQHSIDVVVTEVVNQFSKTVGVSASQLKGVVISTSINAKRGIQGSTGTVEVTATGQGNGSSMVSVFILPIVLFNGLMYFLFH